METITLLAIDKATDQALVDTILTVTESEEDASLETYRTDSEGRVRLKLRFGEEEVHTLVVRVQDPLGQVFGEGIATIRGGMMK